MNLKSSNRREGSWRFEKFCSKM